MRQTKIIMGMPITIQIDGAAAATLCDTVFAHFVSVDEQYSTYKPTSEISRINAGLLPPDQISPDMRIIFDLCEQTKQQTNGYFDIRHNGTLDPSGLVKGWAIQQAAELLHKAHEHNFFISAGGDMSLSGKNEHGSPWRIGIRNPFDRRQIVKALALSDCGVATSGTYTRGGHIYNPHTTKADPQDIVSLTVVGQNIYDADRFVTAAFAMGKTGIDFIEAQEELEGYMIDRNGYATFTSGFGKYVMAS